MAKATADVFERLIDWGVDAIFGLPGDGINGFIEALRTHQDRIERHELATLGEHAPWLARCGRHRRGGLGVRRSSGREAEMRVRDKRGPS
jgi:glyoxylate carboligase